MTSILAKNIMINILEQITIRDMMFFGVSNMVSFRDLPVSFPIFSQLKYQNEIQSIISCGIMVVIPLDIDKNNTNK